MTDVAALLRTGGRMRLEEVAPGAHADEWDELAVRSGSPFLSTAWLLPWTSAYAPDARWFVLRDADGGLRASGCFVPVSNGLAAAANVQTAHWDVAAADPADRAEMWRWVAGISGQRLRLTALPAASLEVVRRVLPTASFGVVERPDPANPRRELPATWDELLGAVSSNLRGQYRRRLRALGEMGQVQLRVTTGGQGLGPDLSSFLQLEASGWKGQQGTAVLSDRATETLYRGFVERAADRGWLRLALLEVGGRLVAGDLSCAFAGGTFMLKTAYDEQQANRSPGLVLRGEALRAAIEDGSTFYDFVGAQEPYKLRWGGVVQPYSQVTAYRGLAAPAVLYHRRLRPVLKTVRDRARTLLAALPGIPTDRSPTL